MFPYLSKDRRASHEMQPDFALNPQSCPYAKPAPKSPFFRCVSSVLSPVLVANLNGQSVSTDSSLDEPHTPSCRVNLGPVWPSSSHQSSAALAAFRYSRLDSNADVRNVQLERALEKHSQLKRSSHCHRPGPGPARPGLVLDDRAGPGRYSRVAGNDVGRRACTLSLNSTTP